MKVEVIDARTYVINEKVYEVGSEVQLSEELAEKLNKIRVLHDTLNHLRQEAVTLAHLAQHNYNLTLSVTAHQLNGASIQYAYLTASFANDLHVHLGGLLPFTFNPDKTKVIVRDRSRRTETDFEEVNYTVASVKGMLGMTRMEDQRLFAVGLAGSAAGVSIDTSKNTDYKFQPMRIDAITDAERIVTVTRDLMMQKRNPADTLVLGHAAATSVIKVINNINDGADKVRMEGIQRYAQDEGTIYVAVVSRKGTATLVGILTPPDGACGLEGPGTTYTIESSDPMKVATSAPGFNLSGGDALWRGLLAASNVASAERGR